MMLDGWAAFRPGQRIDLDNLEDLEALAAHRKKYLNNQLNCGHKKGAHQDQA